ncbi:transposase [Streptomyces sp. x-19]|uniref:transposase n=1 Tax=Streptomyces sp. x-19 TaxID=2789280 RepID=UPI00397F3FF7
MAAPGKYSLELRERAVRMYRTTEPRPQIKRLAVDLGVHPEALRGWIRQAEADAGERGAASLDLFHPAPSSAWSGSLAGGVSV